MKNLLQNPIFILVIRLFLGALFIFASLDKIADPQSFARSIDNYHIIPFGLENSVAVILPWLELLIGLGLVVGCMVDGAAIISMSLLVIFIVAISSAILRGYNIDCGCGLKEGELVGTQKLLENTILFLMGWVILNRPSPLYEIFPKSD
ncbi:MAG: MauE/DoxX family redox-associated membrane protein [Candidatus Marinimicrobia bacterium]|nr:MauE/DoxX family redox-associated membrane protein [Candidatus Neomarinimicrobiota bacterium]